MKYLYLFLLLFAVSCAPQLPSQDPTDERTRFENGFRTVAALVDNDGFSYCSGVFVDGQVYTAAHCARQYVVRVSSYEEYNSHTNRFSTDHVYAVVYSDVSSDVAVLEPILSAPPHLTATIALRDPSLGEEIVAFGNPGVHSYFWSRGQVTNEYRISELPFANAPELMRWFQINAHLIGGMSGGPIYREGDFTEVVGLNSFIWYQTGGAVHTVSLREARASVTTED